MNLQDVSHIHIPDGDVRMIHDSDNRLLWGAVGYNVLFSGNTFQQSYTGKNLIAVTRTEPQTQNGVTCTWDGASFTLNGTSTASVDFYGRGWWGTTFNPIALPAGTYTMSLRKRDGSLATDANFSIDCYHGTTHIIGIYRGQSGAGFSTVTFDSDTQYSVLYISLLSGKTYNNEKFYIQLEKSDLPTTYEPYVGGQPSPSPEYPQPIQTVTGMQTISINGTDYPLDLGSLELCKLGTYQDYIYKDDGEWKIHKAIAKRVFNGTETWSKNGYNHRTSFNSATLVDAAVASVAISDNFIYWPNIAGSIGYSLPNNQFGLPVNKENIDFRYDTIPPNSGGDLLWKTYVTEHNITLYTAKTASAVTDITITDTNLIAQLEAIYNLVRRYGYNFVVSASGNNLPIIIDRTLL